MCAGLGLIIYGLFAVLCGLYARVFPTPPPSGHRHKPMRASVEASEQASGEASPSTDGVPATLPDSSIRIQVHEGEGQGQEAHLRLDNGMPAKSSAQAEKDGQGFATV